MIRRMTAGEVGMILEWDEETEQVALAQACRNGLEREVAYSRLIKLQEVMRENAGLDWVDTELTERVRPVCGVRMAALVWRADMRSDGGARVVARLVGIGLGVGSASVDSGNRDS